MPVEIDLRKLTHFSRHCIDITALPASATVTLGTVASILEFQFPLLIYTGRRKALLHLRLAFLQ